MEEKWRELIERLEEERKQVKIAMQQITAMSDACGEMDMEARKETNASEIKKFNFADWIFEVVEKELRMGRAIAAEQLQQMAVETAGDVIDEWVRLGVMHMQKGVIHMLTTENATLSALKVKRKQKTKSRW